MTLRTATCRPLPVPDLDASLLLDALESAEHVSDAVPVASGGREPADQAPAPIAADGSRSSFRHGPLCR